MAVTFPILKGEDYPFKPSRDKGCPSCGRTYEGEGFAFIGGGASYDLADGNESEYPRLGAFFNVGYHGKESDMSDSGVIEVVKDLTGGQFDLQFCSTPCLRLFFSMIVDEVEKMSVARHH